MNIKMPSRVEKAVVGAFVFAVFIAFIVLVTWVINDSRSLPPGPQLTNLRIVYVEEQGIWFGCDGTVGVYRSAFDNQLSAVLGHPECV